MSIYCSLAFGALSFSGEDYVKPCCNLDNTSFLKLNPNTNINSDAMVSLRDSLIKGEWPESCFNCKNIEAINGNSMRLIYNDKYKNTLFPLQAVVDPKNITYLDLFLSNKCNSKCLTCSPKSSDYWQEEYNFIYNTTSSNDQSTPFTLEKGIKLIEECPNVKDISFIGGEPTIITSHIEFLKYLIDTNKSSDISLMYNTNLTGLDSRLLEIWKNFKTIGISLSVDGYDKVNEYIRYPFKWSKIDNQIDMLLELKTVNIGLACTLSVFNFIDIPNLFEYWYKKLRNLKNDGQPLFISSYLNRVTSPEFMQFTLLSNDYRRLGLEKCQELIDMMTKEKRGSHTLIETLEVYKHYIEESQIDDSANINKLKYFISKSDQFRNRNIKDFIPSLAKELNL